ncbi:MAG: hypothetical protein Q9O62_10065 [Ardenticatenia bacterium]|nr:hypothetical protein [Ardenticatenia bacterium]
MRLVVWVLRHFFPAGRRRERRRQRRGHSRVPRWSLAVAAGLLVVIAVGTARLAPRVVPPLPPGAQGVLVRSPTPAALLERPLSGMADRRAGMPVTERVYVPVAASLGAVDHLREVSLDELRARWRQTARLVVTEEVAQGLATQWGEPGNGPIVVADALAVSRQLLDVSQAVGVVAFDELLPAVRALSLDGLDPLDRTVSNQFWPLRVFWQVTAGASQGVSSSNRDREAIGVVVLTGVTAPANGPPAQGAQVALFARSADVWHMSVRAFGADCTADGVPACGGKTCSKPS